MNSAVWDAATKGEFNLLEEMIRSAGDVNQPYSTNLDPQSTLLHELARLGNVQHVRTLLKYGANPKARDLRDRTPLHWAVSGENNPEVIELLIDEGADVDARCVCQSTPFYRAVSKGSLDSALLLIESGACIEAVSDNGWTAMHLAAYLQKLNMIELLVDRGMDIDVEDCNGDTPLSLAVKNKNIKSTEFLIHLGANVNFKKSLNGHSLLHAAACVNSPDIVYLLLRHGARANDVTNRGNTPLHAACHVGAADVTALLLKFEADINVLNCEGLTAFELLPNKYTSRRTARILIKHSIKLEALGKPACEKFKLIVQRRKNYFRFYEQCCEEIRVMRSEKIDVKNSSVTYFHVFSREVDKLATLTHNRNIAKAFETNYCQDLFKVYGGDLIFKFASAQRRANFLTALEDYLDEVSHSRLPAPIVQKIARHFAYKDAPSLVSAVHNVK